MLRLTTVIMTSVKSDKVKQSLDDLEKYRLFTEGSLKPFIQRIRAVWFLSPQDHAGRRNMSFTHSTSIDSRRKKQPRNVFQKFFTSVVQSWSGLHRMLADFWYLFVWLHSWFLHFSWIEHSSKTIKASSPFTIISLFWNFYEKVSINRMNDGQANH